MMLNQAPALKHALNLLANEIDVLPATGGALEDLEQPDIDEMEDLLINGETKEVTDFLETPTPTLATMYRPTPPLGRAAKHLYRYFIDGSLRTYYLGTGIEGQRSFPIELAQIGAAVMERNDGGGVRPLGIRHRLLLLLPRGPLGASDSLWKQLETLNTPDGFFAVRDTIEKTVNTPADATVESLRVRAGGIARNRMHKLEIEMIGLTNEERSGERWLILDGAVKLDEFIKTPNMIGVAKNFRKDPVFIFGKKHHQRRDVAKLLAGLPHAHRSAVFSSHAGKVAFWYVRLRSQGEVDYPLMGVVKVELPRPDGEPVTAELADLISRTLVAERNVTCFGQDRRWHCHLYPIFLAEQAIKNRFYSSEVLGGLIRWPKPVPMAV